MPFTTCSGETRVEKRVRGLFDGGRLFLNTNTGGGLIITDTLTFTRFQLQYFRSWNHHDLNISLKNDDMSAGGAAAAEAAGEDSLDAHAAQALPPAPTAPPSPCRHRHAPGYASYSTSRRRSLPRRAAPLRKRRFPALVVHHIMACPRGRTCRP